MPAQSRENSCKSICSFQALGLAHGRAHAYLRDMTMIGTRIDETGTLLREGNSFILRRDLGGRWKLDLHRVLVDHVEKRVRIIGTLVAADLVDVDGVSAATVQID